MKNTVLSTVSIMLFLIATNANAQSWSSDPELKTLKAFPGAEGYGQNVSGGRGGKVVAVTTLADAGSNPPSGSLRWALSQHSGEPITVVFRVSGIIELKAELRVKRENYTIAGQTAPGDGILIMGDKVNLGGSKNMIIRHIRFRVGTMNNDPAGKGSIGIENASNFIIDHCTFGWSGEENMTIYDNDMTTIQWSIVHEGLYNSGHDKGNRGYGTQWGGQRATYHHNLLAHNNTRSPRFNGARSNDKDVLIDYVNNVNYNWGRQNSCYGGDIEHNTHRVNFINNYYKPGPARPGTSASYFIQSSFHANQNTSGAIAQWYMSGNYMGGTANTGKNSDNYSGLDANYYTEKGIDAKKLRASSKFTVPYPVTTETAEAAYNSVLAKAGAFPRDAVDKRIVQETQNGTASGSGTFGDKKGMIDSPDAVGGYPKYTSATAPADTDGDGIPDAWETANGLNPNSAADGATKTLAGTYTNLEVYLYDLHRKLMPGFTETNRSPTASVTAPSNNTLFLPGQTINITATASDLDGSVAKVEFLNDGDKLGEKTAAPYTYAWVNPPTGVHTITAKATDNSGTSTTSAGVNVIVGAYIGSGNFVDSLILFDPANAAAWSIGNSFKAEAKAFGDRDFAVGSPIPAGLQGTEWISSSMATRTLTSPDTIIQFKMKRTGYVNILYEDRVTEKPAWLSSNGFVATNAKLLVQENSTTSRAFTVYSKKFESGTTVSLGPNSNNGTTTSMMYLVAFTEEATVPILGNVPHLTHFSLRPLGGSALLVETGSPTVVDIFDLEGNIVSSHNVESSQILRLSLRSGVYFVKARGMHSIKFVAR